MTAGNTAFSYSMPDLYERHLGSMLFEPYAADLATRVGNLGGSNRILEIAAGTGIVTRRLAAALRDSRIEATDLSEAMVTYASARATPNVCWSVADAMALPFGDGQFDATVCQFGVMFFPDREQAFREARRVLKPTGTLLFSVWDDLAHNDVPRIISETLAKTFPSDPPSFLGRVPYGRGDPIKLERELRAAGFDEVAREVVEKRCISTARDAAIGFCRGTPLNNEIVARAPDDVDGIVKGAVKALQSAFGGDAINATMRAFVITAR